MKSGSRLAPGLCWARENEAATSVCGGGVNMTKQQTKPKTPTTRRFLKTPAKHVVKEAPVVRRGAHMCGRVLFSCINDLITLLIQKNGIFENIFVNSYNVFFFFLIYTEGRAERWPACTWRNMALIKALSVLMKGGQY